nr:hypothetical protein BaRGS_018399 [Batillaria attramentaria]
MITLTVSYPQLHPPFSSGPRGTGRPHTATASRPPNMQRHSHHHNQHHAASQRKALDHKAAVNLQTQSGDTKKHSCQVEQLFENFDQSHSAVQPAQASTSAAGVGSPSTVGSVHGATADTASPRVSQARRRVSSKSEMSPKEKLLELSSSAPATSAGRRSVLRKTSSGKAPSFTIPTDSVQSMQTHRTSSGKVGASHRMSGEDALRLCPVKLTEWEKTEIVQFRTVYYLGQMTAKKAALAEGEKNNYFDDSDGFLICKPRDHLLYRYEVQETLGTGTFGQVVKALDHKNKNTVAVKIVKNERPFLRQAREEIRILETLRKIDLADTLNIVHMLDSFTFRGHVCIAFELLGVSLHQLLKRTRKQGFSLGRVQRLTRGILRCLEVLYKNRIVHCDLKPENILLRRNASGYSMGTGTGGGLSDCSIKIIDFGSSCYEQQQVYTYIQSRYYRAPEVILGLRYTCAIDMWSLACVMGELLVAEPLFAGEDEFDQLTRIMEVRGVPPRTLLDRCKSTDKYFNANGQPRYMTSGASKRRGPPMSVHLSSALKNCEVSSRNPMACRSEDVELT